MYGSPPTPTLPGGVSNKPIDLPLAPARQSGRVARLIFRAAEHPDLLQGRGNTSRRIKILRSPEWKLCFRLLSRHMDYSTELPAHEAVP